MGQAQNQDGQNTRAAQTGGELSARGMLRVRKVVSGDVAGSLADNQEPRGRVVPGRKAALGPGPFSENERQASCCLPWLTQAPTSSGERHTGAAAGWPCPSAGSASPSASAGAGSPPPAAPGGSDPSCGWRLSRCTASAGHP